MAKTRIGERLSQVVQGESKTNRCPELGGYIEKYEDFRKKFAPLLSALKNHHSCMEQLEKSHEEVLNELAGWIRKSPILLEDNNVVSVQMELLTKEKVASQKFMQDLVEYVQEWELVVKTRVDAGWKQVKELKTDFFHYEKKMESLTKSHEAMIGKDKTPSDDSLEKLKRNEEKLALAKTTYESRATELCNLLEEIIDRAWKDILPLLLRMMKLDSIKLDDQKAIVDSSNVIQNLRNLAEEYKIDVTTPAPGAADVKASGTKKQVSPSPEEEAQE